MNKYIQLVLTFFGILLAASCSTEKGNETEMQVIKWLGKAPYRDSWNHYQPTKPIDYGEWIAQGRKIPRAAEVLAKLLAERDDRVELPQVAYALGWLGHRRSVPTLVNALAYDEYHVRIQAATALGEIGDELAVNGLCELLQNESNINVRASAVVALGKIGGTKARLCLERSLSDQDDFVARLARECLDSISKDGYGSIE